MTNNDILRGIHHALGMPKAEIIQILALSGWNMTESDLCLFLKKEKDPGFVDCPDILLDAFLNGLIVSKRGPREYFEETESLNNNQILRKLRIALQLKDTDIVFILEKGGMHVSKSELSALFRKPAHRNYKCCQDQLLRKFLIGLRVTSREDLP
ncbi:MAG: DUF1456 family protein [Spartobacteria bacterium]|nr:DUF1456 family protein [Spartobacteria bacterium]